MVLRHKIHINSEPENVWTYISEPSLMQSWNKRIKAIVPVTPGGWAEGSRFRLRYEIRGRESNYLAEIFEYQEPSRLVIHMTGGGVSSKGYIQEIYSLTKNKKGTILRHDIEIYHGRLQLFPVRVSLILNFFRTMTGRKHLRDLKGFVEGGSLDIDGNRGQKTV